MSIDFSLVPFDPCPILDKGIMEGERPDQTAILALDIQAKFLFVDDKGRTYHEYSLPSNADINNVGGYVGKHIKYRDPELLEFLKVNGISKTTLAKSNFPILHSRSPNLDAELFHLIQHLQLTENKRRITLFDLGCTVAEHWTLLDVMLRSQTGRGAQDVISYTGLDKSPLLLTVARLLHQNVAPEHFQLLHLEGSGFSFPPQTFDLSLCVGVVNHVYAPLSALEKLLVATRYTSVLALWTTTEPEGFWTTIHSGLAFYFFSVNDLQKLEQRLARGHFFVLDYLPEASNSQARSYIGLGAERTASLGCYHLLYSTLDHPHIEQLCSVS